MGDNYARRDWPVVVVANTLPVRRRPSKAGAKWEMSPGGLVSALRPIVEESGGAWVGWAGVTGPPPQPFTHANISLIPVPLSSSELKDFYYGFCNRTLWPLYHDAVEHPEYHRHWWAPYLAVNERFARATAEVAQPGGLVWVQDYHLQLVPAMLRRLRPDLRIGFFLHIPFPPQELFARLPWRVAILEGILGADVIGFQTRVGVQNFVRLVRRYTGASVRGHVVNFEGRSASVGTFPISIDFAKYDSAARDPKILRRAEEIRNRLDGDRKIILGVDRLDYTKGIDLRLKALWELLQSGERSVRDCMLVQVAVPSRERVAEYVELRSRVEELVGQINGQFGEVGMTAVHYFRRHLPFEELIAMYRAAQVMLVTPLCDGMNLVAKEYVAARYDDTGVLILSEFAGAARELRTAVRVNPHDVDALATSIDAALTMTPGRAARRMRRMREVVSSHTVYHWAESFMEALAGAEAAIGSS